ncbi:MULTISPECIES: tail fiber/spike domain-containing protein [Proteus]|uniref:Tail spike TSP1/Gp66 N-terminal domain-containing protein n=1 Tax=Proteus cibi TaxID=2050966 RepID=A0ABU6EDI3_9GAMM|nr:MULTISPECIES: hypothetical protein [Proteus]AYY80932.1 hypothetical protein EGX81_08580 [Proteus vulgaris]MCT8198000.1 hypothetical protein [Proteus mirabilis]MEB6856075.1 hypothetical protein [Proteus cibi]MEB7087932.1 hypothetical protein [Proteus cibi]MEC3990436.1 hypothetical protein [Proteus mirabilis]
MTVSTELSHEEYVGNGVTTDFDFRFRIFESKHLIVVVADSDGNETTLKNGTDYTIVGAGSYHGGKVVLNKPLAQDWKILLERDLPVVQETDLRNQGKFFAEVHEDAFDYLTMLIQKALGTFSLSLRKPTYLSNYYDAKGNRIANLAPPKFGSDSANKDYVDNSIKNIDGKTLRVKDKPIPALPSAEQRRNKQLGFDNEGYPQLLDPAETGSLGYVLVDSFEKGAEITTRYQALHWESNGEYYRWDGDLPKYVPLNSSPENTGEIGLGRWVSVGDVTLRNDIKSICYILNSVDGEFIPNIYNYILLKGRYLYYRINSSEVKFIDGVEVIRTMDGSTWTLDNSISKIFASDFCENTSESLNYVYSIATKFKAEFYIDKNFENLLPVKTGFIDNGSGAHLSILTILSNSCIRFINNAFISLSPKFNRKNSNIIYIREISNFEIHDPHIVGDRLTNNAGGEWGYGITIYECKNGVIYNPICENMHGDGIYIGKSWGNPENTVPENIRIIKPICKKIRRNGISLTSGVKINIIEPDISDVGDSDGIDGALPKSGIDIEPEGKIGYSIPFLEDCIIHSPMITNCYDGIHGWINRDNINVYVDITGTTRLDKISNIGISIYYQSSFCKGIVNFDKILFVNNPRRGVEFSWSSIGELHLNISELVTLDKKSKLGIYHNVISSPKYKQLGNVYIGLNPYVDKGISYVDDVIIDGIDVEYYIINLNKINKVHFYNSGSNYSKMSGSVDCMLDYLAKDNIDTKRLPDEIIFNISSSSSEKELELNSKNDFRKIKYSFSTNSIKGKGMTISGVKILKNGIIYTKCKSKNPGDFIILKNNENIAPFYGYSECVNIFGDWEFLE